MKQLILLIYAVAGLLIAPCAWADPGSKLAIETTSSGYQLLFPAVAVCGRDVHVCSKDPAFCAGANMYAVPLGDNWPGGKDPTTIPTEGLAHGSVSQTGKVTIPVPRGQTGLWGEVLVNFLFVKGSIKCDGGHPDYPNPGAADGDSFARSKTNAPATAYVITSDGKHRWLKPKERAEVKRTLD